SEHDSLVGILSCDESVVRESRETNRGVIVADGALPRCLVRVLGDRPICGGGECSHEHRYRESMWLRHSFLLLGAIVARERCVSTSNSAICRGFLREILRKMHVREPSNRPEPHRLRSISHAASFSGFPSLSSTTLAAFFLIPFSGTVIDFGGPIMPTSP